MPIIKQVIGVFVAPVKTPINPSAAKNAVGSNKTVDRVEPSVAPISNRGVTSPPWNPAPRVKAVNTSFHKNANISEVPSKAC